MLGIDVVFWVEIPYRFVGRYQHFRETLVSTSPYCVIMQKTNINIFTTMRNSNLIFSVPLHKFITHILFHYRTCPAGQRTKQPKAV
jgi:hypothetical protein